MRTQCVCKHCSYVLFCLPRDKNLLFSSYASVFSPHLLSDMSTKGSVLNVRRWFACSDKKKRVLKSAPFGSQLEWKQLQRRTEGSATESSAKSHSTEHHAQTLLSGFGVNQSLHPFRAVKNSRLNGSNCSECLPRYQFEGKSPSCNWAQIHLLVPY